MGYGWFLGEQPHRVKKAQCMPCVRMERGGAKEEDEFWPRRKYESRSERNRLLQDQTIRVGSKAICNHNGNNKFYFSGPTCSARTHTHTRTQLIDSKYVYSNIYVDMLSSVLISGWQLICDKYLWHTQPHEHGIRRISARHRAPGTRGGWKADNNAKRSDCVAALISCGK